MLGKEIYRKTKSGQGKEIPEEQKLLLECGDFCLEGREHS